MIQTDHKILSFKGNIFHIKIINVIITSCEYTSLSLDNASDDIH